MSSSEKESRGFIASDSQGTNEYIEVTRVSGDVSEPVTDMITAEEPLEIQLQYGQQHDMTLAITMRTPGHDDELAVGFLYGEGIIHSLSDVLAVEHCTPPDPDKGLHNVIKVTLNPALSFDPDQLDRHFYMSSSCGVCGKTSLEAVQARSESKIDQTFKISADSLKRSPSSLLTTQTEFTRTGGLHSSGLINEKGEVIRAREDVGRHNALDKLIGSLLLEDKLPIEQHGLLLSGRASFELLQKATLAGIGLVAAVGPPSTLAVDLARDQGITLAGFVRDEGFNIYTHPERIRR